MPPTELVLDIRRVEDQLIFAQVAGRRSWEELLDTTFRDEYPDLHLRKKVVATCMERIGKQFVPIRIMDIFREDMRLNAACK